MIEIYIYILQSVFLEPYLDRINDFTVKGYFKLTQYLWILVVKGKCKDKKRLIKIEKYKKSWRFESNQKNWYFYQISEGISDILENFISSRFSNMIVPSAFSANV